MKLYDVPNKTRIRIIDEDEDVSIPPSHKDVPSFSGGELLFHHLDGMYSLCIDEHGDTVHIAGWTEVEIVE